MYTKHLSAWIHISNMGEVGAFKFVSALQSFFTVYMIPIFLSFYFIIVAFIYHKKLVFSPKIKFNNLQDSVQVGSFAIKLNQIPLDKKREIRTV